MSKTLFIVKSITMLAAVFYGGLELFGFVLLSYDKYLGNDITATTELEIAQALLGVIVFVWLFYLAYKDFGINKGNNEDDEI